MRRLIIAFLVVLGLGFGLVRGANFTSRPDVPKVSRVENSADQQQLMPPWISGAVLAVGVALLVAGARKQA